MADVPKHADLDAGMMATQPVPALGMVPCLSICRIFHWDLNPCLKVPVVWQLLNLVIDKVNTIYLIDTDLILIVELWKWIVTQYALRQELIGFRNNHSSLQIRTYIFTYNQAPPHLNMHMNKWQNQINYYMAQSRSNVVLSKERGWSST